MMGSIAANDTIGTAHKTISKERKNDTPLRKEMLLFFIFESPQFLYLRNMYLQIHIRMGKL